MIDGMPSFHDAEVLETSMTFAGSDAEFRVRMRLSNSRSTTLRFIGVRTFMANADVAFFMQASRSVSDIYVLGQARLQGTEVGETRYEIELCPPAGRFEILARELIMDSA